jgi:hypothetical protein
MKTKIQIAVALLVIVATAYFAFNWTRPLAYSGSGIMFPVGNGHVVITNTGSEPIPIEMRGVGRTTSFRVESPEIGLAASSTREGSGRNAIYSVHFDLPPGQARIDVVRGSDVALISRSDTRIEAVVTPRSANAIRWTLILSGGVILWALYYISSVTGHRWLQTLRGRRAQSGELQPRGTGA